MSAFRIEMHQGKGYLPAAEGGGDVVEGEEKRRISRYIMKSNAWARATLPQTTIDAHWSPFCAPFSQYGQDFQPRRKAFNLDIV